MKPDPNTSDPLESWIRRRRENVPEPQPDLHGRILQQLRPPLHRGWVPMSLWLCKVTLLAMALGMLAVRIYLSTLLTLSLTEIL